MANSLGVSDVELTGILDELDRSACPGVVRERRDNERLQYRYRLETVVVMDDSTQPPILVQARNLSRSGLAFLHSDDSQLLQPNKKCTVFLETFQGDRWQVDANRSE